jgi:hypothetical protein
MLSESDRSKIRERSELLNALEAIEQIGGDSMTPRVDEYHCLVGRVQVLADLKGPARQLVHNILDDALARAIERCSEDLREAIQLYGCPLDRLTATRRSTNEYSLYRVPEPPVEQHDTDATELKPVEVDDEDSL